ncbi:MAG: FAD-binding oxidoreductase [Pseudomonadota bacterium]
MADDLSPKGVTPAFLETARQLLGDKGLVIDADEVAPYIADWRGRWRGETPAVVKPASTEETAAFMKLCAEHGVAVTPQGGNTGLVNGGVPYGEILISMTRMRAVRDIDPINDSITVEAGAVLANVQDAAEEAGRFFPLSLGSEGNATIGGLISTNAGGVAVLRYGMMRDLVLGLEAVLPDGRIWNGLTALRKDNTGYDLKHLFIGAEGTLGVVTAATLKLFPQMAAKEVAWASVASARDAVELLSLMKQETGGAVTSFELIPARGVDLVLKHIPDTRDPLPSDKPWRVLVELSFAKREGARDAMETALGAGFEKGLVDDAVIAESDAQSAAIWKLRETLPEAEKLDGKAVKHDVSVPISALSEFVERTETEVLKQFPGTHIMAFGHVGDGNMHYNVVPPASVDDSEYVEAEGAAIMALVHDIVGELGGSISAEHGIGLLKRDDLAARTSPVAIDLMQTLKAALDPDGRMNPGRVIAAR